MKKKLYLNRKSLLFLIGFIFLYSSCSDPKVDPELKGNPDAQSINTYFSQIPGWKIDEINTVESTTIHDSLVVAGEDDNSTYMCSLLEQKVTSTIKEFISVGTNFGKIWPGALLQGNSLEPGDLKLINTKRAPLTLVTSITLDEVSKTIEDPNSVNVQQAISDFKIAADKMPEGNGAGTLNFRIEEASSFEQSMLSMGISGGFREPQSKAGLEGGLSVSADRSSTNHTVIAKFVQEMFTIRVADDLLKTPADFFSEDFSMEDLQSLENSNQLGPDNIPIYIESVTYGRLLLFSMESTNVASASTLSTELNASMTDYAQGGGNAYVKDTAIFNHAQSQYYSSGGSDEAASAAVHSLQWADFFVESSASAAVPISFTARTLNGKIEVKLINSATSQVRDNCSLNSFTGIGPPEDILGYRITVDWVDTQLSNCIGCTRAAKVIRRPEGGGVLAIEDITKLTTLNDWKVTYDIYYNDPKQIQIQSIINSGIPGQKFENLDFKTYPYNRLKAGNNHWSVIVNTGLGSAKFIYNIRKEKITK